MASRLSLDSAFRTLIGSNNVYFQPPESVKLKYPCIIYSISRIEARYANNNTYKATRGYDVTYIDKNPDSTIVDSILTSFSKCKFDRHYVSDGLNHYVYTIYY